MGKTSGELGASSIDPSIADDSISTGGPPMTDAYAEATFASGTMDDSADVVSESGFYEEYDEVETADESDLTAQREQIERTRADMSEKLNAIQSKLSPEHLTNQAKEAVRDATIGKAQHAMEDVTNTVGNAMSGVTDTVSGVTDTVSSTASDWGGGVFDVIRENPIPAALAGVGIGWLVMSFRKQQSRGTGQSQGSGYYGRSYGSGTPSVEAETRYPYRDYRSFNNQSLGTSAYGTGGYSSSGGMTDSIQGKVGDMAGQAQDTASQIAGQAQSAMSQAQDTATQLAGQASDTVSQFAGQAQDAAGQVASQAQYTAQRAGNQLDRMIQERPLAVGIGALALGLAVGLAIPETPQENEWMGETREQVMDRAQSVAQDTAQKVSAVAGQTFDAAKEAAQQTAQQAAQQQGLTGSGQNSGSGQMQQVEFTPEASVDTASDLSADEPTQPQPASRSSSNDGGTSTDI